MAETTSMTITVAEIQKTELSDSVKSFLIATDVLYIVMGVISLVGNVITICAILKFPQLRKVVSNVFVVSLCLADIGIFPPSLLYPVKKHVPLKAASARAYLALIDWPAFICTQMSLITHVCIAVDRLLAVTLVMKYRLVVTKVRAIVLTLLSWIYIAVITGVINLYYGYTANIKLLLLNRSFVVYVPSSLVKFIIMQTWVFIIVIIVIYVFIYFKILHQKNKVGTLGNEQTTGNLHESGYMKRMRKTTKMMATIVGILLICYIPFSVYTLVVKPYQPHYLYIYQSLHIVLTVNSCINPFIYCWLHIDYRKAYMVLLGIKSKVEFSVPSTTASRVSGSM